MHATTIHFSLTHIFGVLSSFPLPSFVLLSDMHPHVQEGQPDLIQNCYAEEYNTCAERAMARNLPANYKLVISYQHIVPIDSLFNTTVNNINNNEQ